MKIKRPLSTKQSALFNGKECGELLGFKEFYKMTDYDYIGEEEIKKVLCELKAGV